MKIQCILTASLLPIGCQSLCPLLSVDFPCPCQQRQQASEGKWTSVQQGRGISGGRVKETSQDSKWTGGMKRQLSLKVNLSSHLTILASLDRQRVRRETSELAGSCDLLPALPTQPPVIDEPRCRAAYKHSAAS